MSEHGPAPLLVVEGLVKRYPGGPVALAGVTLQVCPGERVVLLGRNGAGKTTLIRCILGLLVPDAGRVRGPGDGTSHAGGHGAGNGGGCCRTPIGTQVGVIFEDANNSYPYLTVLENVMYFGLLNGWPPATARRRAVELLDQVGLSAQARNLTQSLSRGMRQKLAMAVAMTKDAPLLLLDEPTLGLDIEAQHALRRFLRHGLPPGCGALIATHDAGFAHAVGTRFVILDGGRLVWQGTPDQVTGPETLEALFLKVIRRAAVFSQGRATPPEAGLSWPRDPGTSGANPDHEITRVVEPATGGGPDGDGPSSGAGVEPSDHASATRCSGLALRQAPTTAGAPGFGNVLRAAWIKKRAEYRRYWLDFVIGLAIKCIFFLGALFAVPDAPPPEAALRVLGFGLWYLSAHGVAKLGNMALEEAYMGTAEQVLVTRTRPSTWLAGTLGMELLLSIIWVGLFSGVAALLIGPNNFLQGLAAIASPGFLLAPAGVAGMVGIGLAALGLSLRFKQVGSVVEILLYYLLVFSGFFLPPGPLPAVLDVLNAASPLARVVEGIRGIGHGTSVWQAVVVAWAVALAWIAVGCAVLRKQWLWARRAGRLGSIA
ncbi:ABC transporter ATP-binding protein/permease [Thermaerobacter litoralis]